MSAAEVAELIHDARHLPIGWERVAVCERAVQLADLTGDDQLAYDTRRDLMDLTYRSAAIDRRLVAFAWMLGEHDRHPERGRLSELLWYFKWVASDLPGLPNIPRTRVAALLDDMDRRFAAYGSGRAAALRIRHGVGIWMGDPASVAGLLEQAQALPRDALSDCEACDATDDIRELVRLGLDEQAIARAERYTTGDVGCSSHPVAALALTLTPLLRTGQVEEAVRRHRRALRLAEDSGGSEYYSTRHIELLARTGSIDRGIEVAVAHGEWAERVVARTTFVEFLRSVLLLLEAAKERDTVRLPLPAALLAGPDAAAVAAGAALEPARVAAAVLAAAMPVAQQLDARNGNTAFVDELLAVPAWLAQLQVDAPLEPRQAAAPVVQPEPQAQEEAAPEVEATPAPVEPDADAGWDEVWAWVDALYESRRMDGVDAALDRAEPLADTDLRRALCQRTRAFMLTIRGDGDAALVLLRQAAEVFERNGEAGAEELLRCWTGLAQDEPDPATRRWFAERVIAAAGTEPREGRAGTTRIRAHHLLLTAMLAEAQGSDELPAEARQLYDRLVALAPGWTTTPWMVPAAWGVDLAFHGYGADADGVLDPVLPGLPAYDRLRVLNNLARGHLSSGDRTRGLERARAALVEAEGLRDEIWVAEASLTLGRALMRSDPELALAPLRRVVRIDDAHGWVLPAARARLLLGETLDQVRREEEAVEVFDVAGAASAESDVLLAVDAWYRAAGSLRDVRDLDGALTRLERATDALQASDLAIALPPATPHVNNREDGWVWPLLPAVERPGPVLEQAYWSRALLERRRGDLEIARGRWGAVPALERAAALHLAGDDHGPAVGALTTLARELLDWSTGEVDDDGEDVGRNGHAGRALELLALADGAVDRAAHQGRHHPGALELDVDVARVSALLAAGRGAEAVDVARSRAGATEVRHEVAAHDGWLWARALATLGRALARTGDARGAAPVLTRAAEAFDAVGEPGAAAGVRREREALEEA